MKTPAIGRIVHAVVKNHFGTFVERPAIITHTCGEDSTAIHCTVFFDREPDGLHYTCKSSLGYFNGPLSPATNTPDAAPESWHWPEDKHTRADGSQAAE